MIYPSNPNYPPGQAMLQDELLTRGVMSRRLLAWLLDGALIAVILSGLWSFCLFFGLLTLGLGWPLFGVLPAVPILYHWLAISSPLSATPGQAMMGLCVRRDFDLGPPGGLQALVFALMFYLTLALGAIWMGIALFTTRHRTIHDMLSGLVVVRARALTQPAMFWNSTPGFVPPGGPNRA
jgi:uncharacterized RDD family membrane protein YckC